MIEDVTTKSTKSYQCNAADVASLPTNVAEGSQALILDTADVYIFSNGAWTKLGGN